MYKKYNKPVILSDGTIINGISIIDNAITVAGNYLVLEFNKIKDVCCGYLKNGGKEDDLR